MREAENAEKGIAREMPRKVKNLIFNLGLGSECSRDRRHTSIAQHGDRVAGC